MHILGTKSWHAAVHHGRFLAGKGVHPVSRDGYKCVSMFPDREVKGHAPHCFLALMNPAASDIACMHLWGPCARLGASVKQTTEAETKAVAHVFFSMYFAIFPRTRRGGHCCPLPAWQGRPHAACMQQRKRSDLTLSMRPNTSGIKRFFAVTLTQPSHLQEFVHPLICDLAQCAPAV